MNCDEAKTMLAGYADAELGALEADAVVAHLEQCGRCRQTVRDQQRVQHVLDSVEPPPVPDDRWEAVAKVLRAELEGKNDAMELRTRPRVEGLEPTPLVTPALSAEEAAAPPREAPAPPPPARDIPAARPRDASRRRGALTVLRVRPQAVRPSRFGWMAHLAGAAVAAAVVLASLTALWNRMPPPLEAGTLARQSDVAIMGVKMLDAGYNLILMGGDASDVAAVWVVPDEEPSG